MFFFFLISHHDRQTDRQYKQTHLIKSALEMRTLKANHPQKKKTHPSSKKDSEKKTNNTLPPLSLQNQTTPSKVQTKKKFNCNLRLQRTKLTPRTGFYNHIRRDPQNLSRAGGKGPTEPARPKASDVSKQQAFKSDSLTTPTPRLDESAGGLCIYISHCVLVGFGVEMR